MNETSLYERVGGEAALTAAVGLFYRKVLADERTRPFFEGLDMQAQTRKQVAFMAHAFGGPEAYKGRDLTEAHAPLVAEQGLDDTHFDAIAGHLKATLEELGVGAAEIEEALGIVASTREAVLSKG